MTELTVDRVDLAWEAIAAGDRGKITEYWAEDVRFEIPGSHAYAGWYEGLDEFLGFLGAFGRLSGGTIRAERITAMVDAAAGYSVDVNHNTARRAGLTGTDASPYRDLDVDALHLLRWRDGRVVEGRWVILGDGVARSELWFSPIDADGTRSTEI